MVERDIEFRVSYDKANSLWRVRSAGQQFHARRLILDAKAKAAPEPGHLLVTAQRAVGNAEELRIEHDEVLLPEKQGRVNHGCMLEWCVAFDGGSGRWATWRQTDDRILVMTEALSLECHAVAMNGTFFCEAEMLMDGRTNKTEAVSRARSVTLRTLVVFDQVVQLPVLAAMGANRLPL